MFTLLLYTVLQGVQTLYKPLFVTRPDVRIEFSMRLSEVVLVSFLSQKSDFEYIMKNKSAVFIVFIKTILFWKSF